MNMHTHNVMVESLKETNIMHKIVYNSDFGGFSLSVEAIFLYYKKKEIKVYLYKYYPEKGQYIGINEKDANKIR